MVDSDPVTLDLDDPARRAQAVQATVEAARTLLPPGSDRRLAELSVFAEDESIPVPLIARLWTATGALTEDESRTLCAAFDRLSLISLTPDHGGRVAIHDVLRDYLHKELGEPAATALHATLADAFGPRPWESSEGYVLDHAIEHLLAAGRTDDAERVASDLRWIETRLHQRGPMAAWADLFDVPTRHAARLADDLTRTAHLLTPTDPPELLTNVLHSRLESLPLWRDRIAGRQAAPEIAARPLLRNRTTPPDLPEPALLRTFLGHTGPVWSIGVRSDGTSLITVGADGMARGLDPESGGEFTVDVRGPGRFRVLAVAPYGTELVTGGPGRNFHTWTSDRATPPTRTVGPVGGRGASVRALAACGSRIATVATDGTLEIWAWSGNHLAQNVQQGDEHTCVAFSANGVWLAVGGRRRVRLMSSDLAQVQDRGPTAGAPVNAIAIARDGSWIVSAEANGVLQIWDETPPHHASQISAHKGPATAVAVSPDGTWLVSSGEDGTVAVWDRRTRECRARYTAHTGPVHALAVTPDGGRVISTGADGTVRVWDSRGPERIRSGDSEGMRTVTVVGDAEWLAVAHRDGSTRLCDSYGDTWSSPLSSRHGEYRGPVAFAPHGSWYAAGHLHGVEIKTIDQSATVDPAVLPLGPSTTAQALAVATDGRWLAVADSAGALQLWNRLREVRTATVPGPWGADGRAHTVAIAPDGDLAGRAAPPAAVQPDRSRVPGTGGPPHGGPRRRRLPGPHPPRRETHRARRHTRWQPPPHHVPQRRHKPVGPAHRRSPDHRHRPRRPRQRPRRLPRQQMDRHRRLPAPRLGRRHRPDHRQRPRRDTADFLRLAARRPRARRRRRTRPALPRVPALKRHPQGDAEPTPPRARGAEPDPDHTPSTRDHPLTSLISRNSVGRLVPESVSDHAVHEC